MVILQPLAGMDGGQHEGTVRAGLQSLNALLQLPQMQEELPHRGRLIRQGEENVQFGGVPVLLLDVIAVAHVPHQPLDGGEAGQVGQLGVVGLHGLDFSNLPRLQLTAFQQDLEDAFFLGHPVEQPRDHRLFQLQINLVVKAEEQVLIAIIKSELQHIGDVPHQRAGEEEALPLAAGVGDALLLQQVDEGQGAVVVAVEDRRGLLAVLRDFQQIAVLPVVVRQHDLADGAALRIVGAHFLRAAVLVAADESVRLLHDGAGGAVVGLQLQHFRAGKDLLKLQQCLGPRRPEAVDALVLIANHEDVAAAGGQQAEDGVLNLRGVLGLVHADVGPPALEVGQNVRVLPENAAGEDHLVIVVHPPGATEVVLILKIHPWEVHPVHLVGVDLRLRQHHVLAVGDVGAGIADLLVAGKGRTGSREEIPDHALDLPLIVQQGKCFRVFLPGVVADHHRAQAVDGAEGQLAGVVFPKDTGKPGLHVLGSRHGVGHGEDALWRDALAVEHVSQPGHQHGGLAAPRHSQQQDGALRLADGLLLLTVQLNGILGFEFFVGHGRLPQISLQSF